VKEGSLGNKEQLGSFQWTFTHAWNVSRTHMPTEKMTTHTTILTQNVKNACREILLVCGKDVNENEMDHHSWLFRKKQPAIPTYVCIQVG
jgi:CO dehydrogenase/acetyl-CoA synthase epsilon subunit